MILASTLAVRGGEVDYFAGNGKIYDGSFDYDTFPITETLSTRESNGAWLFSYVYDPNTNFLIDIGEVGGSLGLKFKGEGVSFGNGFFTYLLQRQGEGGDELTARFTGGSFTLGSKYILIIEKQGVVLNAYLKEVDGVKQTLTTNIIASSLTAGTISLDRQQADIGRRALTSGAYYTGAIKQLEYVNGIFTTEQIDQALNSGSFRGANIEHSLSNYSLAIDFNKQNGQPLTTFANTPSYTITPFGGSEYVDYESL